MAGCCLCYENAWKTWPFCVDSRLGTNCKSATHNPSIQRFRALFLVNRLVHAFSGILRTLLYVTRGCKTPEGECSKFNAPLKSCSNYYVLHSLFSCHLLSYIFTMQSTLDTVVTACMPTIAVHTTIYIPGNFAKDF